MKVLFLLWPWYFCLQRTSGSHTLLPRPIFPIHARLPVQVSRAAVDRENSMVTLQGLTSGSPKGPGWILCCKRWGASHPDVVPQSVLFTHHSMIWAWCSHPGLSTWIYQRNNIKLHNVGRHWWNLQSHTCVRKTAKLKPPPQTKPTRGLGLSQPWSRQHWSPLTAHRENALAVLGPLWLAHVGHRWEKGMGGHSPWPGMGKGSTRP